MRRLLIAFVTFPLVSVCGAQQSTKQFAASEGCPADRSSEPAGKISPTDFVELKSVLSCMDACPIYSVRVRADGTVTWNGVSGVETQGSATRQVAAEAARALIERYRTMGFWRLCHPPGSGEDGPAVITTVHIGDREKSGGTPDWEIYRAVGALAGTYSWIRGDPAMESVAFPMKSDSAFAPKPGFTELMRAAWRGDGDAIGNELNAGAKVNAQDSSGCTALMYAARTTDPQVLKILLIVRLNWRGRSSGWKSSRDSASAVATL